MATITKKKLFKKLGNFVSARNLNHINQFIIEFENGEVFQSYNTLIGAYVYTDKIYYFTDAYNWSSTTSRHRVAWSRLSAKEIEDGLKNESITKIKE